MSFTLFFNCVVNLQTLLQSFKNLLRLLHALFGSTNLESCFLEGNSLLGSKNVLWYLNLGVSDKLLCSLSNLSIIKHSYRLAPAREDHFSCSASLLEYLAAHASALPVNLAHGILGTLCLVAARQFTDRNFTFHDNDIRTNPCRLKLVIQRRA